MRQSIEILAVSAVFAITLRVALTCGKIVYERTASAPLALVAFAAVATTTPIGPLVGIALTRHPKT